MIQETPSMIVLLDAEGQDGVHEGSGEISSGCVSTVSSVAVTLLLDRAWRNVWGKPPPLRFHMGVGRGLGGRMAQ